MSAAWCDAPCTSRWKRWIGSYSNTAWAPLASNSRFTEMDRVRYRRDKAFVARLCVQAVNRLFEASGAHAVLESDPIQRFHRDVHGASHHAALTWDLPAEQFGRQALGLGKSQ